MRVTLLTAGSRGDVEPYVSLGCGLRRAGLDVTIATHEGFGGLVTGLGLGYVEVPQPGRRLVATPEWQRWQASGDRPLRYATGLRRLVRTARPLLVGMLDAFWRACRDADAVVSSSSGIASVEMARELAIPHTWALFQPLSRTRQRPLFVVPELPVTSGAVHAATYAVAEQVYRRVFRPAVEDWSRAALGRRIDAAPPGSGFLMPRTSRVLCGFSQHVVPRPPDWPAAVRVCGYWHPERPPGWRPSPALARFLAAGSPPVVACLHRLDAVPRAVVQAALARSGHRGILVTDGDGLDGLPPSQIAVGWTDFGWLLPRAAAVVHHGGAGTTASALRAGAPSVVVPRYYDQPFWGRRIRALGVGATIRARDVTAGRLAGLLAEVTAPEPRSRAAALAARLRTEDGVAEATRALTGGWPVPAGEAP